MSPGPEDLLSQREKREVLENDRRVRDQAATYLSHTHDDLELGGRFAKQTPQTVVGATPVPDYPAAFQQHDPVPDEPPLGFSIEDHEPLGTEKEIQASIERLGDAGFPSGAPDGGEEWRRGSPENAAQSTPSPLSSTDDDEPPRAA